MAIAVFLFAFFITTSVNAANTYTVPGNFETIQKAIDASSIGHYIDENNQWVWDRDTILVAPGTYFENLTIKDKSVILKSAAGPDTTIIDGGNAGRVLTIRQSSNTGANATRPIIEGFTLTHGNDIAGGAVYALYADPTFRNCIIEDNNAMYGGGVYATVGACYVVFEDSIIANNHAELYGGGIYGIVSCTRLQNSKLINNSAGQYGGGDHTTGFCTSFNSWESVIAGNTAGLGGGAVYNVSHSSCGSGARTRNTLIAHNSAQVGGALYVGGNTFTTLDFSTLAHNTASSMGGAFYGEDSPVSPETLNPSYTIANSILYHNTPEPVLPTVSRSVHQANMNIVAGSVVEGCVSPENYIGGETNICVDPLFVDPANGDYSLSPNSPAIDIAVSTVTFPDGRTRSLNTVDHDIDGNSRPEGGGYDIGAYEFSLPVIEVPVNLDPNTLNLKSKGRWITAYITLPAIYDPGDVLVPSVMIDGGIPAVRGKVQDDVLMVKFDRDVVANYLAGENGQTRLTVTGEVNGQAVFTGTDSIKAMNLPANNLRGEERIQSIGQ